MTNISFHFNVADTHHYVCRLVKKAWSQQIQVLIVGERDWLEELDAQLWTFSDVDFIPHAFIDSDADELSDEAVRVWLAAPEQLNQEAAAQSGFLIHCGNNPLLGFERFERLIEIVPQSEDAKALARQRWSYYKHRGYPLTHHDAKN